MSEQQEAGFRILNIIILESEFKREAVIDFQHQIDNNFALNTNSVKHDDSNNYSVYLKAELKGTQGDRTEFFISVWMVGMFEKFGQPEFSDEQFTSINAPAIIFPFVREHIASLAIKGGIGAILLPPVNFLKK
jgi:preprotein translocase subunit SecB